MSYGVFTNNGTVTTAGQPRTVDIANNPIMGGNCGDFICIQNSHASLGLKVQMSTDNGQQYTTSPAVINPGVFAYIPAGNITNVKLDGTGNGVTYGIIAGRHKD